MQLLSVSTALAFSLTDFVLFPQQHLQALVEFASVWKTMENILLLVTRDISKESLHPLLHMAPYISSAACMLANAERNHPLVLLPYHKNVIQECVPA